MEVKNYPLGVTQELIDEWKRIWKGVTLITVKKVVKVPSTGSGTEETEETKEYHGFFRKPDLKVMSAAGTFSKSDPLKSGEVFYNNCKLKVDPEMDSDDELKVSAMLQVAQLFIIHETEVKNL